MKVLLIDADGQGNVGASLGIRGEKTLYHVLVAGARADHAAVPVRDGLDVLTSNEMLAAAELKLAELPRNSSPVRIRNRCEVTGRPRGVYRKLKMSRIALRELGSLGLIPGLVKSSW